MSSSIISVRVPEELKKQLEALSGATHRSKSYLAAKALEEYLERNAWKAEQLQEAAKEADKGVFVSGQAVNQWLESWGTDNETQVPKADTSLNQK